MHLFVSADYNVKSPSAQDFSDMNEVADDENLAAMNGDTNTVSSHSSSDNVLNSVDQGQPTQEDSAENTVSPYKDPEVNEGDVVMSELKEEEKETRESLVSPSCDQDSMHTEDAQPNSEETPSISQTRTDTEAGDTTEVPEPSGTVSPTQSSEHSQPSSEGAQIITPSTDPNFSVTTEVAESNQDASTSLPSEEKPSPVQSPSTVDHIKTNSPSPLSPSSPISSPKPVSVETTEVIESLHSDNVGSPTSAPSVPVKLEDKSADICKSEENESASPVDPKDSQSSDKSKDETCDVKAEDPAGSDYDADDEGMGTKTADDDLMPPPPVPDDKKSDGEEESEDAKSKKRETPLASMLPSKYAGIDVTEIFPDFRMDKVCFRDLKQF